jgi:hypothetical protein
LADELLAEESSKEDAAWEEQLNDLRKDSEETVQSVELEVEAYRLSKKGKGEGALAAQGVGEDGVKKEASDKLDADEQGDGTSAEAKEEADMEPWQLEGAFKATFPRD